MDGITTMLEKLFTDGMSVVGGNGFNSQTSASRQTLCSYSHASIFCASGDKLKFGKKDKISIVIALRKYKSAETSDKRAICVERHIFCVHATAIVLNVLFQEGRVDPKSDGYVAGYKNKKSADAKMRPS